MTQPFRAHAWVSVNGTPIGEGPNIHFYTPILVIGPSGCSTEKMT